MISHKIQKISGWLPIFDPYEIQVLNDPNELIYKLEIDPQS